MKKIFGILAMCAFALVGCNDTPEPEPQPIEKNPVVTLDKQSVEAPAEGGTFSVNYTIENAQEGVALSVTEDVAWISDAVAADGVITFVVAANDAKEAR
jgi:PBP1b-binding outer membrane lipoprotein LpoB